MRPAVRDLCQVLRLVACIRPGSSVFASSGRVVWWYHLHGTAVHAARVKNIMFGVRHSLYKCAPLQSYDRSNEPVSFRDS